MSGIKKLAGQTLWYGAPKILSRFLNYGLTLLGFRLFDAATTSDLTQVYAIIPFLSIIFMYGLETSYFRFAQLTDTRTLYHTLSTSLILSTLLFTGILFYFRDGIASFFELQDKPRYIDWMIGIVCLDTLAVLPLARLRQQERPIRYALVNMASILVNIGLVFFFLFIAKPAWEQDPHAFPGTWYNPDTGVGYFILANLLASGATLLFLYPELSIIRFRFKPDLWKNVMQYSYPLIIVGLGGMTNEMLSRLIYKKVATGTVLEQERALGIFGANYKLAVLITIFIQIFRLAAEPFFFNQSGREDARKTYARVMKFFVIACCLMFLGISLFLDFWQILIASRFREYAEGIHIVPILAMANVFLGIYYNLSIWYKLTNRNMFGAGVTVAGALITIVLNFWWIPRFGYTGAAWATFICYAFMMVVSYAMGQKHYPIPYPRKKLLAYLGTAALFYMVHEALTVVLYPDSSGYPYLYYGSGLLLLSAFTWLVLRVEARELSRLPLLARFYKRP